jgi:hypothetical protein
MKRKLFLTFILGMILVVLGFVKVVLSITESNQRGIFYRYDEKLISSNESYTGFIDTLNNKVSIVDYSGREVSCVDTEEQYPNQIVLGDSSYFLLYCWESDDGAGKIVQYDYQSNKIKEYTISDVSTIACRNHYLFVGNWRHEDEDEFYYFPSFYNGFYANRYIEEEQFGNQFKKLSVTREGGCIVGNVKMYYHKEGYFSTEPIWSDYRGTSIGNFTKEDKIRNYQADTKQEFKNRSLLLESIGDIGGGTQEPTYLVCEYQSGNDIYGVCNVLKEYIPSYPLESKDVIKSYCYNITRGHNEIEIMSQTDSCVAIIATSNVYIYQKDNLIIRRNIKTGDEKNIYEFKKDFSADVYVQGENLLISDGNRYVFIKWDAE